MPKKIERGDSLVSAGMVCYAEKQVKPFWSSSLGQMVQFDTIIFCRTFKNYFGQFVWIEKKKSHYNSRVSLHEAPTKKTSSTWINKPGTAKIGAISRAQNCEKGDPLGFVKLQLVAKFQKTKGGPFGNNKKN